MNKSKNEKGQAKPPKTRLKSDELAKRLLSQKLPALEFAQEYLPENLKKMLDLDTIKPEQESYIEEDLKKKFSDIESVIRFV